MYILLNWYCMQCSSLASCLPRQLQKMMTKSIHDINSNLCCFKCSGEASPFYSKFKGIKVKTTSTLCHVSSCMLRFWCHLSHVLFRQLVDCCHFPSCLWVSVGSALTHLFPIICLQQFFLVCLPSSCRQFFFVPCIKCSSSFSLVMALCVCSFPAISWSCLLPVPCRICLSATWLSTRAPNLFMQK